MKVEMSVGGLNSIDVDPHPDVFTGPFPKDISERAESTLFVPGFSCFPRIAQGE
jgi:hypothetical protein